MPRRMLIAYASRHGSTEEVAEAIAAVLRGRGLEADVRPADNAGDLEPYDAVVLGGAIYTSRWHHDARWFLHHHREELVDRPFAIYGMGPRRADTDGFRIAHRVLDVAVREMPGVEPAAVAVFGGVIDPMRLHFPFSRMKPEDARDWDAIRRWAAGLPEALGVAESDAGVTAGG